MVPEAEPAIADPFAAAAKELAAAEPAVTQAPESSEAPSGEAPAATEGEGGATAESQEGAKEATGEDGAGGEGEDVDGSKALRSAVARDPALAMVPEIRQRLGLPALNDAPDGTRRVPAPIVSKGGIPTEEETMAAYEASMKAGDEVKATRVLAHAEIAPVASAVQFLLEERRRDAELKTFKDAHPDWKKHDAALGAEVRRRQAAGIPVILDDVWNKVVRPGPAPKATATEATEIAKAELAKAAKAKTATAASAAGAPTNQRPVGTPSAPIKALSPAERAASELFGKVESRGSRSLYPDSALNRTPKK